MTGRSLDTLERDLARLAVNLPRATVDSVTTPDLILVLQSVPPKSQARVRWAFGVLFRWAQLFDHRPDDPMRKLPKLKPIPKQVYDIFDRAEQAALVAAAKRVDPPMPIVHRARTLVRLTTGGRAAELCGIRLSDIDLAQRHIVLWKAKGGKSRLVPIRGDVVRTLDEYLLTPYPLIDRLPEPSDYLWFPVKWRGSYYMNPARFTLFRPEQPLSYSAYFRQWQKLVAEAGVKYRKPHMTRHTYATDVLDATGGDLYSARDLLGHVSVKTTEGYVQSQRHRLDRAADALAAYRELDEE